MIISIHNKINKQRNLFLTASMYKLVPFIQTFFFLVERLLIYTVINNMYY